jgi:hypothetical protein
LKPKLDKWNAVTSLIKRLKNKLWNFMFDTHAYCTHFIIERSINVSLRADRLPNMTFCGPARDTVLTNRQKLNFDTNYITNSYINTRENWENSQLCENTPPSGRRVSTQFLVFPISTRVDITVYHHGKCFVFVKYKPRHKTTIGSIYKHV